MKSKPLMFVVFAFVLLAVGSPAFAHHGNASLSTDKVIVMKDATVARFIWANPHCIVAFDAKDEKGNVVRWAAEVGSPSAMNQMGWNRNSVKPGDVITVFLFPAKTGNPVGRINKIVLADGTTLRDSALGNDRPAADAPAH
jgi:Family of unknown function (DUF6152)